MKLDHLDLAWAAGFFDGEGTTCATRHVGRTQRYLKVSVTQIHRETLERFRESVGGLGAIYGPYSTKSGVFDQFLWRVSGYEESQAAIAMMWPWLTPVKRQQAMEAFIAFRQNWSPRAVAQHGTVSRYGGKWQCRCDPCVQAYRDYHRE